MKITISGIEETIEKISTLDTIFLLNSTANIAKQELKKTVGKHVKTGMMLRRVAKQKINDYEYNVGIEDNNMLVLWKNKLINYAVFVRFGTKDHDIYPKDKKALRWSSPLGFIFSKHNRVKGIKPDDFIHKAAINTLRRLDKIIKV